jgi:prolyl-tRNA editing enzyme YbaK/EbsC (Cys-tRNA(Pro) deacylase)
MASILHETVAEAIATYDLQAEELACDPDFADTAAFNEKYGFTPEQAANTIVVVSKKVEPTKYAVCVVLASTRLDVNKMVTKLLDIKRASFADGETTRQLTGMEIGGVTAIGISNHPIFIDAAVMDQPKVVMGGGNRSSKVVLTPNELLKLPNVSVVSELARPV